jgi:hypothetical protein
VIYVEDIDAEGAIVKHADSPQEVSPTSLQLPLRRSARHRSYSVATTVEPDSEEESISETMPSSSRTRARSSSASEVPSSSSKGKKRSDDWTEVTEPEERRRIQNRIAQRKFRECQFLSSCQSLSHWPIADFNSQEKKSEIKGNEPSATPATKNTPAAPTTFQTQARSPTMKTCRVCHGEA